MPARLTPAEAARLLGEDAPMAKRKYRNVPTVVDGERFDSKAEARRWGELRYRLQAGEITDLERQVRYPLWVNGVKIGVYVADFFYRETATGTTVVEDVKGGQATVTAAYRMKRKLMEACHGFIITEVQA